MGCFYSVQGGGGASSPASAAVIVKESGEGWPPWLSAVAGEALHGLSPRRPGSFLKLDKIGSGTYSNVYKAMDMVTGQAVALKKVRLDGNDKASAQFTAREIAVLRRLGNHPNIVRLEGLVTSRVSHSLYLAFEYMEHDLAGLSILPEVNFSLPQIKCYMKQLLEGLEHCHKHGVLHRDIKGSNLLLDNKGNLKLADFGLATTFDPDHKKAMTSRVVTLWYRPPELLFGAKYYGVGVDLWSAGCILAELLTGKPILPGRTEVEQLHRIFKLCGSPSENYWKKAKLSHATMFKPQQPYKRCIVETFKDLPPSAVSLIDKLLQIDPTKRGSATAALNTDFFKTEPYACEPSSLPQYPPSKELDAKLRDEKARRQKKVNQKGNCEPEKQNRSNNRGSRALPAPQANAELRVNLEKRWMAHTNAASKSEKFPPPHQDAAVGIPQDAPRSFIGQEVSFSSFIFDGKNKVDNEALSNSMFNSTEVTKQRARTSKERVSNGTFRPSSARLLVELNGNAKINKRVGGQELAVFGTAAK